MKGQEQFEIEMIRRCIFDGVIIYLLINNYAIKYEVNDYTLIVHVNQYGIVIVMDVWGTLSIEAMGRTIVHTKIRELSKVPDFIMGRIERYL